MKLFIVSVLTVFSLLAHAEEAASEKTGIYLSYQSWMENIDLSNGLTSDRVQGSFVGLGLRGSREFFGLLFDGELMFGSATAGGNSQIITFSVPQSDYWALLVDAKKMWQINNSVEIGAGPYFLTRQVTWKNGGAAINIAEKQASFLGLVGEIKLHLDSVWELNQQIAWLPTQSQAYWELGVGRTF